MPGRKLFLTTALGAIVLAAGLATLAAFLKHEPNFYRQTQLPPGKGRKDLAFTFVTKCNAVLEDCKEKEKESWGRDFSEAELNSFFQETFENMGESETLRKLGISAPSVILENDNHLRLAFRYDTGWFSTIVSYDLKIWLVQKEPNTIAVEFQAARAGALPISSQTILQQLCEFGRKQDFKVNLFRHEGNSVAVIQLRPNENHPTWLLTALKVKPEEKSQQITLSIRGKTLPHALKVFQVPHAAPEK